MWKSIKAFYDSKEWELFRKQYILSHSKEKGVICSRCGEPIATSKHIILHHTPIELSLENVNDYNVSLNKDNVRIDCFDCHNKDHERFGHGNSYFKKRHNGIYIVYGPPLSGKTTFVLNSINPGDLVVDMDRLYEAVSFQPIYCKPDNLKFNVLALRNMLIDNIKTRFGMFNAAYIIGGYPKLFDRERLAKTIGAELVFIEATKEKCMKRLESCKDRNVAEWREYIERWFAEYTK